MYNRFVSAIFISLSLSVVVCQNESEGSRTEDSAKFPPVHLSILLVTVPFPGHAMPFLALGEELVRRGHNVTLVTAPSDLIRREVEKRNINLWSIREAFPSIQEISGTQSMAGKNKVNNQIFQSLTVAVQFQTYVIKVIDNTAVTSFDIIVGDSAFFTCLMCVSRKWNIKGVYLSLSVSIVPFDFHAWPFPAVQSGYTDNLTFIQRLVSTVNTQCSIYFTKTFTSIYSLFTGGICKKVNISLNQLSYHTDYHPRITMMSFGFDFPHATLPLSEYVGPILSQLQPQLPQDIAEWLGQRDRRSVVYVSMGSTGILTSEQAEMIINGATQANLSVVWSLKKSNQHILEHMTYDPDNVLIAEWLPQVTILKHPSIYSAILHGGLGGIQEALTSGVPIIVIPFIFEQMDNGVRVQHYHYGEMLYLHELTAPLVVQKLRLIGTELYRKSLKKIQKIYKKDGGASRAADLVEFYSDVGYEHLVPSYAKYNWSWVEFHNVDVYVVLILAVLLPSYLLYRLIRSCCSTVLSKSKRKVE